MNKIIICFGTRPELIKIAPVVWEFKRRNLREKIIIVNTNQHIDTIDLDTFDVSPDYNLSVFSKNQSLSSLYSKLAIQFDDLLKTLKLDGTNISSVLIQGDTASAFNLAQTSFLNEIPVLHLEAGLRSNIITSPFPEEYNRRVISIIADYHFVPSDKEYNNLLNENISKKNIEIVGNTINDSLLKFYNNGQLDKTLDTVLITIHRKDNQNKKFELLLNQINEISILNPELKFIWIAHHDEKIKKKIELFKQNKSTIQFVNHLNYTEIIDTYRCCKLVITDSGGVTEETARLGIPRIIVRNDNERHGIINLSNTFVFDPLKDELSNKFALALNVNREPSLIYGNQNISKKIVDSILNKYL